MSKRSFKASQKGIEISRRAFERRGWTQEYLAAEVNLKTRQPIWRFFTGKPIERHTFMEICEVLNLNWWEIAENPPDFYITQDLDENLEANSPSQSSDDLKRIDSNELMQHLRLQHQEKILAQCGEVGLFRTNRILNLSDIYIDINLVERGKRLNWLLDDISNPEAQLSWDMSQKQPTLNNTDDLVSYEMIFENYSKIKVVGKPGSGKTTLLQHIASQCSQGRCLEHYIPVFITLEKLSRHAKNDDGLSLFSYACKEFQPYGLEVHQVERLLHQGSFLFLLDGLDEISDRQCQISIAKEINYFAEDYYRNLFVVTCRTGAQTVRLLKFTDFEMAELTFVQIEEFIRKWFAPVPYYSGHDSSEQTRELIDQLQMPENWQIKELVCTPLMLSLICQAFYQTRNLFSHKDELYQECLYVLLFQWDQARGIQRCAAEACPIPLTCELNILSSLASETLNQGKKFFDQHYVGSYIEQYIRKSVGHYSDPESSLLNQVAVIESMIAHHGLLVEHAPGIYSFSNTALHEHLSLWIE